VREGCNARDQKAKVECGVFMVIKGCLGQLEDVEEVTVRTGKHQRQQHRGVDRNRNYVLVEVHLTTTSIDLPAST
jgi:hypothetical protein